MCNHYYLFPFRYLLPAYPDTDTLSLSLLVHNLFPPCLHQTLPAMEMSP